MSREIIQQHVEQRLHTLANTRGISSVEIEWGFPHFGMGPGRGIQHVGPTFYPIAITVGTIRETAEFSEEELDDRDWPSIERKLTTVLRKISPPERKIGFRA